MKKLFALSAVILCLLVTSCSHRDGKILVMYSEDKWGTFVYDEHDNFYLLQDGSAVPIEQHYECTPAIRMFPVNTSFNLAYVSTGKYAGSLNDARAYCTYLSDNGYEVDVESTGPYMCVVNCTSSDSKVRLYITDDNTVRIYAVDMYNVGVNPPYLTSETTRLQED